MFYLFQIQLSFGRKNNNLLQKKSFFFSWVTTSKQSLQHAKTRKIKHPHRMNTYLVFRRSRKLDQGVWSWDLVNFSNLVTVGNVWEWPVQVMNLTPIKQLLGPTWSQKIIASQRSSLCKHPRIFTSWVLWDSFPIN